MRVFLAGASGAIGSRLVPRSIHRGHDMLGTFRSPGNADRLRQAVLESEPDAIVHQATALADMQFSSASTAASPDESASARRHRRAAGCRARGRCGPLDGPELRQLRARGWAGQERGRSAPLDPTGAEPPRHFPRWLARLVAGEALVMMGTESRGASHPKAKRELGWEPRYPSWREGFAAAYASTAPQTVIPPARSVGRYVRSSDGHQPQARRPQPPA